MLWLGDLKAAPSICRKYKMKIKSQSRLKAKAASLLCHDAKTHLVLRNLPSFPTPAALPLPLTQAILSSSRTGSFFGGLTGPQKAGGGGVEKLLVLLWRLGCERSAATSGPAVIKSQSPHPQPSVSVQLITLSIRCHRLFVRIQK